MKEKILTKEIKLHTLLKEIKGDINKWKHNPWSWIIRINTVKKSVLFKVIYSFNTTPIKIPIFFQKLKNLS
jgi:hypothetical protein